MRIVIVDKAKKELKALAKKDIEKILHKISLLSLPNRSEVLDIKKLKPTKLNNYRLRVGSYRIIFVYDDDLITVLKIDSRQSIYSSL